MLAKGRQLIKQRRSQISQSRGPEHHKHRPAQAGFPVGGGRRGDTGEIQQDEQQIGESPGLTVEMRMQRGNKRILAGLRVDRSDAEHFFQPHRNGHEGPFNCIA